MWVRDGVMDDKSAESTQNDNATGVGRGESKTEKVGRG